MPIPINPSPLITNLLLVPTEVEEAISNFPPSAMFVPIAQFGVASPAAPAAVLEAARSICGEAAAVVPAPNTLRSCKGLVVPMPRRPSLVNVILNVESPTVLFLLCVKN